MNILEAYIKFKKQLIILVSGISGSNKRVIASHLAKVLKLKHIKLESYIDKSYDKPENYSEINIDGIESKSLIWDNIKDSVDWHKFNKDVNNFKTKGVIVSGLGFPTDLINFVPDYYAHINIPKQVLMEKRQKYFDENKDNSRVEEMIKSVEKLSKGKFDVMRYEKYIYNKFTHPIIKDIVSSSNISKFLNGGKMSDDEMLKEMFSNIMERISAWLDKYKLSDDEYRYVTSESTNVDDVDSEEYDVDEDSDKESEENNVITDEDYDSDIDEEGDDNNEEYSDIDSDDD
jgi:hypothetical protein